MQTYLYSSLYSLFLVRLFSLFAVGFTQLSLSSPSQTLASLFFMIPLDLFHWTLSQIGRIRRIIGDTRRSAKINIRDGGFHYQPGLHRCNRGCHGQGPRRVRQQRWSWRGSSQGASSCKLSSLPLLFSLVHDFPFITRMKKLMGLLDAYTSNLKRVLI